LLSALSLVEERLTCGSCAKLEQLVFLDIIEGSYPVASAYMKLFVLR